MGESISLQPKNLKKLVQKEAIALRVRRDYAEITSFKAIEYFRFLLEIAVLESCTFLWGRVGYPEWRLV